MLNLKSHRYVIEREVIVNLTSGTAIAGVVVGQSGPLLILKGAQLHTAGASDPTPIDGEALVHTDTVDFIQIP